MHQESLILLQGAPQKIHIHFIAFSNWVITLAVSLSSICLSAVCDFLAFDRSAVLFLVFDSLVCANWCNQTVTKVTVDLRPRRNRSWMCATRRHYLFMCIALDSNGLSPPENSLGVDSGRVRATRHFHFLGAQERKTDAEAHLILYRRRCLLCLLHFK
jgi:hypothetical protein